MCKLQSSAALSREIPLLRTYGWGMCFQAHDSELNHTQPVSAHLSRAPHIPLAFVSSPQVTISPGVLPPSLSWVKISLLLLGVTSTHGPVLPAGWGAEQLPKDLEAKGFPRPYNNPGMAISLPLLGFPSLQHPLLCPRERESLPSHTLPSLDTA